MSNKVLRHPEKEEIISRLLEGHSVKGVEAWLKKKHPKTKRLHVSSITLQRFRADFLNLEGEALKKIKEMATKKTANKEKIKNMARVAGSNAYQEKLAEIINDKIDVNRKMLEMEHLISSRIEYYFNVINSGGNIREERVFMELITQHREVLRDWKKYVDKVADQTVEHNININVVNEQLTVLKGIILEVLREIEPALIPLFIEKLNSKLLDTQYGEKEYLDYADQKQLEVIDVS